MDQDSVQSALDTLVPYVTTYGLRVLGAILILVLGRIVAGLVGKGVKRAALKAHMDPSVAGFLAAMARFGVLAFAVTVTIVCVLPVFLVGGLAVSARCEPRFTRDIDIAVALADDAQAEKLVRALRALDPVQHVILGGRDLAVPPARTESMLAGLSNTMVSRLPEFGHLVHEEAPRATAKLVLRRPGEEEHDDV